MEKMKLNLDDLRVESFETTPGSEGKSRGTVFGMGACQWPAAEDYTAFWSTCPNDLETGGCLTGAAGCAVTSRTDENTCNRCWGPTEDAANTCASPCGFSDGTDCHRC